MGTVWWVHSDGMPVWRKPSLSRDIDHRIPPVLVQLMSRDIGKIRRQDKAARCSRNIRNTKISFLRDKFIKYYVPRNDLTTFAAQVYRFVILILPKGTDSVKLCVYT